MGCINSKNVVKSLNSPLYDCSVIDKGCDSDSFPVDNPNPRNHNRDFGPLEEIKEETEEEGTGYGKEGSVVDRKTSRDLVGSRENKYSRKLGFNVRFGRSSEGEQVAAGWPAWLAAVAGEAIDGWIPLKSDNFEKLEKIGQGTYSSVYRARDKASGQMVALKKVRFDNFRPESVRFMAREIRILRRLDHPNVMKLEGIITSSLSSSIYFVFEYMEHDLSGLLSCPDIKFTYSQIKCYMRQLLNGIDHCHSRGVLHRDIKASNILVNNKGLLKIADFGLANFISSKKKQPQTSRVVTLWYRPPELLLGSTNYGTYVDMWSVGCVFAELFVGRPILKGRTEVEQLHKIFKLCGTPPKEYWNTSKLPLAAMFKPQHVYKNTLRERCKHLPRTVIDLLETLLSIEPYKRGTAIAALGSEYFYTKPYACDLASLPKYPPNKEIDAKSREEALRKKAGGKHRSSSRASRNPRRFPRTLQEQNTGLRKVLPTEVFLTPHLVSMKEVNVNVPCKVNSGGLYFQTSRRSSKASYDTVSEVSRATEASQADTICTLPAKATTFEDRHEQERFRYKGPMLIQAHRRQESQFRSRRSRFSRDAEL